MTDLLAAFDNRPLALQKSSLSSEDEYLIFNKELYSSLATTNRNFVLQYIDSNRGDFNCEFIASVKARTRVNGAIDVRSVLDGPHCPFLAVPTRLSRSHTHTRGYSYLISRDTGLTAAEKLAVYYKDFFDGLSSLSLCTSTLERFAVSDYVKNAITTMLNAMISDEKLGQFYLDDPEYQAVRSELLALAFIATQYHYHILFAARDYQIPPEYGHRAAHALSYLERKSARRWSRLHGASLCRPEASHPLLIFLASLKLALAYPTLDTIIGLPSGATELAFSIAIQHNYLYGRTPTCILAPVSYHSVKDLSISRHADPVDFGLYFRQFEPALSGRNVLICDDNSSTGRTLQTASEAIAPLINRGTLSCAVAEIDIIRSLLDRGNMSREYVANPTLFAHSINILPVSRSLRPKTDIKELMERREIIGHHKRQQIASGPNEIDFIFRQVMIDAVVHDTREIMESTPSGLLISSIQGTALSNFYAVPIDYDGLRYPSVEHAYQHQKFTPTMLHSVSEGTRREISDAMRFRGYGAPISDLNALFTDDRFNAGNIKIVADILRSRDHGREMWADNRVKTMIALLLIKFSFKDIRDVLLATGSRIIVEGNNWNDTLWGYCDGRGRNLLGRILMIIRDRINGKGVTDS